MRKKLFMMPTIILIVCLIVLPVILLLVKGAPNVLPSLSENYVRHAIFLSLTICLLTVAITHIVGVPVGIFLSRSKSKFVSILIYIMLLSTLTSGIIRIIAWISLLANDGMINNTLIMLHIFNEPHKLIHTNFSILIGMVYIFLPLTVINVYTAAIKIDDEVINAARMLGAKNRKVLSKVIVPQLVPDILLSVLIVFTASISIYSVPNLLGGSDKVLATLLKDYVSKTLNMQYALGIAFIMLFISFTAIVVVQVINKRSKWL